LFYKVHDEVEFDGEIADEEQGGEVAGVVRRHHHVRVADNTIIATHMA